MDDHSLQLQDVSNQFDYACRVIGRPIARRMPLSSMRILIAVLRGSGNGDPATASTLAKHLGTTYEDVASVIRVMKRQRWIDVVPKPGDRRVKFLVLSAKGQTIARELTKLSPFFQTEETQP